MAHIDLVKLFVSDYEAGIRFFTEALDFELVEDRPTTASDGHPKRWVVVRPHGAQTGVLLAVPRGVEQTHTMGRQTADRSGFFLHVDDFAQSYQRLLDHNVEIVEPPRLDTFGQYAMFRDIAGNVWDLLGSATD